MNKNQIIAVSFCALLCIGLYLFTDIKKPKEEIAPVAHEHEAAPVDMLNIEAYLTQVHKEITDSAIRQRASKLFLADSFVALSELYYKIDKPIAVAYTLIKQSETEKTATAYLRAGDYCSMLIETAPDEKVHNYLNAQIVQSYEKAAALDTANEKIKLRLAGAYLENSPQPMKGVSMLMAIIDRDSSDIDALVMLGRFGLVSGQFDKAIARLEKVLYLRPQNSEALLLMAEAYNSKGDKNKAIEYLERCKKTVTNPELKKEIENHIQSIKKPNG